MKRFLSLLTGCFLFISVMGAAEADTIIDTGYSPSFSTWQISAIQSLAGKFTIETNQIITDVKAWMLGNAGQTASVTLYNDGGSTPGTEVYTEPFTETMTNINGYYGVSGMDWKLNAGTYWVAFEVREGQNYIGYTTSSAKTPLAAYAFTRLGSWMGGFVNMAVKIQGVGSQGDVNGDGSVKLNDAALGLKLITSISPLPITDNKADVDGDLKIGLPDIVYILQKTADQR